MPTYANNKKGKVLENYRSIGVRTGIGAGMRTIKMIERVCPTCQSSIQHPLWWMQCDHPEDEVFFKEVEVPVRKRKVEERGGKTFVVGFEEETELIKRPRVQQVPTGSERVNAGRSLGDALYRGAKYPNDLGFRNFCEYRNCLAQPDKLLRTPYGNFCSEIEARLVGADIEEVALEVFNEKKRRKQLNEINLEVY